MRMVDCVDFERYLYEECLYDDLSDLFVLYEVANNARKEIVYNMIVKIRKEMKVNRLTIDQSIQLDIWDKQIKKLGKKHVLHV